MNGFRFDFKKYVTPEAIELCKIRDLLFGDNYHNQRIVEAMELANQCKHPEAVWLSQVVPDKASWNLAGVTKTIKRHVQKNPADRARGYYYVGSMNQQSLYRDFMEIAKMEGYVPAFVNMYDYMASSDDNILKYFVAAEHGERRGFYNCGWALSNGIGCEQNSREAKNCFEIAFALGLVDAALRLANYYYQFTLERWNYLSFAALKGCAHTFIENLDLVIPQDEYEIGNNGPLVMLIGKTLNGNVHEDYEALFQCKAESEGFIKARIVLQYYKRQLQSCRRAVDAWALCARRLGLYKDIRNMISQMIWNDRMLGLYE